MDADNLVKILEAYKNSKASLEEVLEQIRLQEAEELEFACVDHGRMARCGIPEVILGQGKTADQILSIARQMAKRQSPILATRLSPEQAKLLAAEFPQAQYNELARVVKIGQAAEPASGGRVACISAGTSDLPVAEEAVETASFLGAQVEKFYDVGVAGIHRLMRHMGVIKSADVAIVVAGMEGALASVVGGLLDKPVIGVPTSVGYGSSLGGLAALMGMLNSCAANVCVVNIDNGFGAGVLSAMISRLAAKRSV